MAHAVAAIATLADAALDRARRSGRASDDSLRARLRGGDAGVVRRHHRTGRYAIATCDALSIVQVVIAGIGGVGLAVLTSHTADLPTVRRRLVGAAALAMIIGATLGLRLPRLSRRSARAARSAPLRSCGSRMSPKHAACCRCCTICRRTCRPITDCRPPGWRLASCAACASATINAGAGSSASAVLAALFVVAAWEMRAAAAANAVALALVPGGTGAHVANAREPRGILGTWPVRSCSRPCCSIR